VAGGACRPDAGTVPGLRLAWAAQSEPDPAVPTLRWRRPVACAVGVAMSTALDARTVEEIVTRAGRRDFDRWAEQVERCGHCSRPVRLRGRIIHKDRTVGGSRTTR
jgi:hypothetical protein